jgi:hypothetical protein
MAGAATEATSGGGEAGGEGHLHRPPAGLAPIVADFTRIKSVIGIKCPKMKFFLEIGSRQENPASHPPNAAVGSGRSLMSSRWEKGFLDMPPEFASLGKYEENIPRRHGHDKIKPARGFNRPEKY